MASSPISVVDNAEASDEVDVTSPQEREATGDLIQGELAGRTVFVPPVVKWRASGLSALRDGDFNKWAESILLDEDYDTWMDIDPTLGEIEDFFATINPGLGTSPGNSRRSRNSSKITRRR